MTSFAGSGGGLDRSAPFNIGLASGESVTVPDDETWQVTLISGNGKVKINGVPATAEQGPPTKTVATGGDTIEPSVNDYGHIGGYKL